MPDFDVIVVGAGNAGARRRQFRPRRKGPTGWSCSRRRPRPSGAAIPTSAADCCGSHSRRRAPWSRCCRTSSPGCRTSSTAWEPYTGEDFLSDLRRVTAGAGGPHARPDPRRQLLRDHPMDARERRNPHGGGGLASRAFGSATGSSSRREPSSARRQEGIGLSRHWFARTEANGIEVRYGTGAMSLLRDRRGRIAGVKTVTPSGTEELSARAVILACGGFEGERAVARPVPRGAVGPRQGARHRPQPGRRTADWRSRRERFRAGSGAGATRPRSATSGRTSRIGNAPTRAIACPIRSG